MLNVSMHEIRRRRVVFGGVNRSQSQAKEHGMEEIRSGSFQIRYGAGREAAGR